jgi:hypothetical protein
VPCIGKPRRFHGARRPRARGGRTARRVRTTGSGRAVACRRASTKSTRPRCRMGAPTARGPCSPRPSRRNIRKTSRRCPCSCGNSACLWGTARGATGGYRVGMRCKRRTRWARRPCNSGRRRLRGPRSSTNRWGCRTAKSRGCSGSDLASPSRREAWCRLCSASRAAGPPPIRRCAPRCAGARSSRWMKRVGASRRCSNGCGSGRHRPRRSTAFIPGAGWRQPPA